MDIQSCEMPPLGANSFRGRSMVLTYPACTHLQSCCGGTTEKSGSPDCPSLAPRSAPEACHVRVCFVRCMPILYLGRETIIFSVLFVRSRLSLAWSCSADFILIRMTTAELVFAPVRSI